MASPPLHANRHFLRAFAGAPAARFGAACVPFRVALIGLTLIACGLLSALPLTAQSISRGEISGTIRDGSSRMLQDVSVTVTEMRTGTEAYAETGRDGAWQLSLLPAGEYEVLVEARGFLPKLLRGVTMRPGNMIRLNVALESVTGPVERVDTVFAAVGSGARFDGAGGRFISRSEIATVGDRRMGLSGLTTLSPLMDETMGSEGLPGSMSSITLDGFSFTPATHPHQAAGDGSLPLLPRIAIGSLDVHSGLDVEWSGGAGGYVAAMSRPAAGETAGEAFASGTAGALWSSEGLSPQTKPGMVSGWIGGAAHLPLGNDSTRLFIGVEGMRVQTPFLSPLSNAFATRIVDSAAPGDETTRALATPWLNSQQTISGLARADWGVGENTQIMARTTFASMQDEGGRLFAHPLGYGLGVPFDGTDFSAAITVMTAFTELVSLELRGGVERSAREWSGTGGGADPASVPTTRFTDERALLGSDAGLPGRVRRAAFQGGPTVHLRWPGHWVKAGLNFTLPSYEYEHVHRSGGDFLFASPERLATGDGIFLRTVGPSAAQSFLVPEVGLFLQHRWEPATGLRLTTGVRFDHERIPTGDIPLNVEWAERTGLLNTDFASTLNKISPRVAVSWDPTGTGSTMVHGSLAVHYDQLDPAAINEVQALSGAYRERTQVGDLDWPELPGDATGAGTSERTVLALFGPKLQSPRTARTTLGISQALGARAVFTATGTFRRTQFMLRRADLNRTIEPTGTLADGRPVYGTLVQSGSLVTAEPGSNRRFSDFGSVWALNSDGWSDYKGVTLALEHGVSDGLTLFGSYSFSATEDNLVGARLGAPDAGVRPTLASGTGPGAAALAEWDQGVSDFDVPHRLAAGLRARFAVLEGLETSGIYRFHSGAPFTAGYRAGVDVSGDGSGYNDPAFVSGGGSGLSACLNADVGRFATRNGCRAEGSHIVDLHLSLGVLRVGPSVAALTLDLFNLLDTEMGRPDNALFLVDDQGTLQQDPVSNEIVIPFLDNPDFGSVTRFQRPGRMVRVGFKVALP